MTQPTTPPQESGWEKLKQEYRQAVITLKPQEWWLEDYWPRVESFISTIVAEAEERGRKGVDMDITKLLQDFASTSISERGTG
jgi:hypothetical protein